MSAGPLAEWDGHPVEALAARWSVSVVEAWATVGSTNDRAAELIEAAAVAGHGSGPGLAADPRRPAAAVRAVVVADEQTQGRGRRGTPWLSKRDRGLWMSLALRRPHGDPGVLPLVVGLAVAEALEATVPDARVGLKWPNDLILAGRKVGGVLCAAGRGGVVAGVGVNLRSPDGGFPADLREVAISVEDATGGSVSRSELAGEIIERLRRSLEDATAGLAPWQVQALAGRDVLVGRAVETEQAGRGVAVGLAEDGTLRIARSDGTEVRVVAGSVRLR